MNGCDGEELDLEPFKDMLKSGDTKDPAIFMMFSLMQEVSKLRSCVAQLEISTSQHFCKWNGNIPALIEFQKGTTEVRGNIYGRIDRSEKDIDDLTKNTAELGEMVRTLTVKLDDHIKDEQTARKESTKYIKWLSGTLIISIITLIITNAESILKFFGN